MKANSAAPYAENVASLKYGRFLRLMGRWRASIYKVIYQELIIFLVLYYALYCLYMFGLNEEGQFYFEAIVLYCKVQNDTAALTLVLGFYLAIIFRRWWRQYMGVPMPEHIAILVSSLVHGNDHTGRIVRRTVMRYCCLALMMVLIRLSEKAKKRFGTYQRLIDAGILMPSERDIMQKWDAKHPRLAKHWMPIVWAISILVKGRGEGRIRDDFALRTLIDAINKFRGQCGMMGQYNQISIPLIYTQVVTIAVYLFVAANLLGRQMSELPVFSEFQLYIPIFAIIEMVFYLGLLKIAEVLMGPYGDDDQDFDVLWFIERNLQISYIIVDKMYDQHPVLLRDAYWDSISPSELPYPKGFPSAKDHSRPLDIGNLFNRPPKPTKIPSGFEVPPPKKSDSSLSNSLDDKYYSIDSLLTTPQGSEKEPDKDDDLFEKLRAERDYARQNRRPSIVPVTVDPRAQLSDAPSRTVTEGTQADLSQSSSEYSQQDDDRDTAKKPEATKKK